MTAIDAAPPSPKPAQRARRRNAPESPRDPQSPPAPLAVELRDVRTLTPYPRNAKRHPPAQIKQLAASMARWGFTLPVLVDGSTIVAGHGRIEAAQSIWRDGGKIPRLDTNMIPVIDHQFLNESERRAYGIADNKLAENGLWDEDLLKVEFAELAAGGFDLSLTGFSLEEVNFALAPTSNAAKRNRVSRNPPDPAFVDFKFGEHSGKISRKLYNRFVAEIDAAKAAGTAYVLDDIFKSWIGLP